MISICELLRSLVAFPSITPYDAGCQTFMINFLQSLGFQCQRFDNPPVSNFYAQLGHKGPLLIFAGHTDVVPVGEESQWHTPPFCLQEKNDILFGRGTADMKGSLAAMLVMASRIAKQKALSGRLGFLITSGEEGDAFALGTPYVMAKLHEQGIKPDYCVVGEPSSQAVLGDMIKIGRRGSLTGQLFLEGKQGHVAYPHLAQNPIHTVAPFLADLTTMEWDSGNAYFPPTSLQVTHIQAGGEANNIIPGVLQLQFNLRFSTEQTPQGLKQRISACFVKHGLKPQIQWTLNGMPFLTANGRLLGSTIEAIRHITQQEPECSTSGGTSDGRFIVPYGVEVVELGPVNQTIHQVNECVSLQDLHTLTDIYERISTALIGEGSKV